MAFETVTVVTHNGSAIGRIFRFVRKGQTYLKTQGYGKYANLYDFEWEETHWSDKYMVEENFRYACIGLHRHCSLYPLRKLIDPVPSSTHRF